ncbi:GNAT family N-acetyltransferase [Nocardioides terrisoli]|uniref:GNAT family N-acetyltransferase n=1 Tax=Nocardioides terrisoli TaxID=3388267 RepID=UPI00287BA2D5|nr:GNAT family N-acetyltransferase [Nocardioides marmorisolisilvae]
MTVPVLTDGGVTLRRHTDDDIDRCFEQCVDPLSVEWTTVPTSYTLDDARRFVRHAMPGGWATDQEWGFAVEYDGRYAGTISLRPHHGGEGEARAEVAYGSHPDVRGTGAMERALRLLLEWGFSEKGLHTVIWWANEGNWASRRLAWRVGFDIVPGVVRRWLPHRGELRDAWVGTLLSDDDRKPRGPWLDTPVLRLDGLTMRAPEDRDVPRIVEACSDPVSRHWLRHMPDPYGPADARAWIESRRAGAARGDVVTWAITDAATDLMLGALNLFSIDREDGQAEVGYWVHPDARGRGVASTATRAACRHALIDLEDGGLGLTRVDAIAAVDNHASRGALRGAGMREVATERSAMIIAGTPTDAVRYDIVAADLNAD